MIRDAKSGFFDRQAQDWDKSAYAKEQLARLKRLAAGLGLSPGWRVLDVGCGTGVLVPYLLDILGARGAVVGLDISTGMLRKALAKGFPNNVAFVAARAERLPFSAHEFDAALCLSVFPHFQDHAQSLELMEFSPYLDCFGRKPSVGKGHGQHSPGNQHPLQLGKNG